MNGKVKELIQEAAGSGVCCFEVISGSMFPVLKKGDTISVKKCSSYRIGDTLAFIQDDNVVVHRLIWKKISGVYYTKGDAVKGRTEKLVPENIVGKVICPENNVKEKTNGIYSSRLVSFFSLWEYLICRYLK